MSDHECLRCSECDSCPACAADALDREVVENERLRLALETATRDLAALKSAWREQQAESFGALAEERREYRRLVEVAYPYIPSSLRRDLDRLAERIGVAAPPADADPKCYRCDKPYPSRIGFCEECWNAHVAAPPSDAATEALRIALDAEEECTCEALYCSHAGAVLEAARALVSTPAPAPSAEEGRS